MIEKVTFKYFEGRDVEQFTFYRIPKQLFTVSFFKSLSSDAKILYGLMLDRISLSLKNNWFDEQNRAYIYFSVEEVMDHLGCGKNKAIKCMKELDDETGIGLTQKRRQGFGKSNMIYVKTFLVESQGENWDEKQTSLQEKREEKTAGIPEEMGDTDKEITKNGSQRRDIDRYTENSDKESGLTACPIGAREPDKKFDNQTNGENAPDTEVYISNFMKFENETPRSPKNKPQEVYFSNPNNNNYNKTEYSYNKSYLIGSGDIQSESYRETDRKRCDTIRWDQKERTDSGTDPNTSTQELGVVYALIRDNIGLDDLLTARETDRELIHEIYSLIVEMVACKSREVVIASNRYPAELVRSRFLKLRYDHIIYVMDCFEKNTSKVRNIRKYLLTALFNASATMDGYYRAEVRHDMPMVAQGTP